MERQDARDAREPEEPGAGIDAVASATLHAAIEVHRVLGPGFLEGVYENALDIELTDRGIRFVRQLPEAMGLPLALVINFNVPVLLRVVRSIRPSV
jgi:hypothetical protein